MERISAGEVLEADSNLSVCINNFTVFSFVMAHNNKKKKVPYLAVISLFVSKPSTFNSPNSKQLKIFGFNGINFICFGDKRIVGIY